MSLNRLTRKTASNNDMHRSAGSQSLVILPIPLPAPGDVER